MSLCNTPCSTRMDYKKNKIYGMSAVFCFIAFSYRLGGKLILGHAKVEKLEKVTSLCLSVFRLMLHCILCLPLSFYLQVSQDTNQCWEFPTPCSVLFKQFNFRTQDENTFKFQNVNLSKNWYGMVFWKRMLYKSLLANTTFIQLVQSFFYSEHWLQSISSIV